MKNLIIILNFLAFFISKNVLKVWRNIYAAQWLISMTGVDRNRHFWPRDMEVALQHYHWQAGPGFWYTIYGSKFENYFNILLLNLIKEEISYGYLKVYLSNCCLIYSFGCRVFVSLAQSPSSWFVYFIIRFVKVVRKERYLKS